MRARGLGARELLGVLDGSKLLLIALGVYLLADGTLRLRVRQHNRGDTSGRVYKNVA